MKFDNKLTFEEKLQIRKSRSRTILFAKLISIFVIFATVILYFFAPISQVSSYKLKGNHYYSNDDILEIAGLNKKTSLYLIDTNKTKELLENHPLIKSSKVNVSPFGLKIEIEELCPLVTYENAIYMSDRSLLSSSLENDDLIYDHLQAIINPSENNIYVLDTDPSIIDENHYKKLSEILLSIDKEARNYINFVQVVEKIYNLNFFLKRENDDFYVKIRFTDLLSKDPLVYASALEHKKIEKYFEVVDNNEAKNYNLVMKEFDENSPYKGIKYYSFLIDFNEKTNCYKLIDDKEKVIDVI